MLTYTDNDEDPYLSWYSEEFSSVFVATNPFLHIPDISLPSQGEWLPDEVSTVVKQRGEGVGVSWKKISELCGFPSIAHVNRALRLTGSKRICDKLACPSDTKKMLKICEDNNIFIPDEGRFSPVVELSIASFLKKLGHNEVIVADSFGTSPRQMISEALLSPEVFSPPEIHTQDRSIYLSLYIDYHYFLICQTEASKSAGNPMDYFEGFFADENTNDLWGVGDLSKPAFSI